MLVPRFALSQTDKEVVVAIKLPYVRVGDAELSVEGQDLAFYCKPYLLKLHFPHPLRGSEEDEGRYCRAIYDADLDHGTMTLHLEKASPGQDFPDLDLTTSLLQPVRAFDPSSTSGGAGPAEPPRIEVLHSEQYIAPPPPLSPTAAAAAPDGQEKKGEVPEAGAAAATDLPTLLGAAHPPRYGFNRSYSGVFRHLRDEMAEVLRVPDPEVTPEGVRTLLREAEEAAQFDGERYLGDLMDGEEDPLFQEAMALVPFYLQEGEGEGRELEEAEREELAGLRNREFLPLDSVDGRRAVALGLLDLLLAFAYDFRTTGGEPTVESCWTLATLSPSLSWLETYHSHPHPHTAPDDQEEGAGMEPPPPPSVAAVIRTFYRRSLTYPYLRLWKLSARCVADARAILLGAWDGRRRALRCMLRARGILRRTEAHYLLNRVFLDDYCAFLQQREMAEPVLAWLGEELRACGAVGKGNVGLDLLGLEALVKKEEEEEEEEEEEGSESESSAESESEESGSEGESESDLSESESESEEEEDSAAGLVKGLQQVRLGDGGKCDQQQEEEDEEVIDRLASLAVAGDATPKRETLDVRPLSSLLLAPQAEEKAGSDGVSEQQGPTAGEKRRPLVEEIA